MAVAGSPTVRRRRLGAELRAIREASRKRGEEVAASLGWSPAKLSRYELARTMLQESDVVRLLDYYQVTGEYRAQLLALARDAAEKGWWEEESDAIPSELEQLIGLEAEARSLAIWRMAQVPGLLQTEAYARKIISSFDRVERVPPAWVERRVRVRMRRQEVLSRNPPLELKVVLDESVLRRRIGDNDVMYEQLLRLAREAERPNVSVQILPFDVDHPVTAESFIVISFGRLNPDDPTAGALLHDVVSTETLKRDFYVDGESETHLHSVAFEILSGESLDPGASKALILETANSLWHGVDG